MAALQHVSPHNTASRTEVLELSQVPVEDLLPLFAQEVEVWQRKFNWDFRPSADLLARFIRAQSLFGYVLRVDGLVAGYTYFVCEHRKGLIGDFFLCDEYATPAHESLLLEAVVSGLMRVHGIKRIECQLMNLRYQNASLPFGRYLTHYDRTFMTLDASRIEHLTQAMPGVDVSFVPWAERYSEEVAHLVSTAYRGHVDSDINDQYRNIPGARHFLVNIIRYPGCGTFSAASSVLAVDRRSSRVCGVCLASKVGPQSGHITQLCILPGLRGSRLGYELMRQSLVRLRELGSTSVSLTVTCSNVNAIRLYEAIGFEARWLFPALVWEHF